MRLTEAAMIGGLILCVAGVAVFAIGLAPGITAAAVGIGIGTFVVGTLMAIGGFAIDYMHRDKNEETYYGWVSKLKLL